MNDPFPGRGRRRRAGALALLAAVAAACQGPLIYNPIADEAALRRQLRSVEPLDLTAVSQPPPPEADDAEPDGAGTDARESEAEAAPAPPPPPPDLPLTVAQARAIALEHNLDLRVDLLTPTLARQDVTEAEAAFEFLFFTNVSYVKTDTPVDTQLEGSQVDFLNADAGVRVPLRTGGAITIDLPLNRTETNNPFSTLNPSYTADLNLSISHPLLRNAGLRVNEHPIRIAHLGAHVAEAQTKLAVIGVLSTVERVYWQLYAARRELEVRQQELELARDQLRRARRQVDAGVSAEVEIVRAEAGVAERLEAIIIAENNIADRQRDLKRILNRPGLGMNTPTVIVPETRPNPMRYRLDADTLTEAALDNRMEMLEIELRLLQDASTVDLERNRLLPLILLDYAYNVNGLGRSFSDAFDVLADKQFEDHRIGFRGELPLGNQAAESRFRRAVLTRLQRVATKAQRRSQIIQEVLNALDQLESDWQRILAARQRTVLAARVLEAEQRQFGQGLRTSTDVLDAQTRLADAQSAEVRALSEYQISQIDIAQATGTLLGSARVRWAPAEPPTDPYR